MANHHSLKFRKTKQTWSRLFGGGADVISAALPEKVRKERGTTKTVQPNVSGVGKGSFETVLPYSGCQLDSKHHSADESNYSNSSSYLTLC